MDKLTDTIKKVGLYNMIKSIGYGNIDEVLGKVANTNLDHVKIFFDKIKKMYEIIFLISHNPIVQDWGDKIITIEKNNDISSLQIS